MKAPSVLVIVLLSALALVACGGSDEAAEAPKPTSVTAADLDKDGTFWVSLTPDLKDELVDLGKSRLGEDRPDGAPGIKAVPTSDLIAEMEKDYANEAKRSTSIYVTYTAANDKIAQAKLNDALGGLDELCNGPTPPPECDE